MYWIIALNTALHVAGINLVSFDFDSTVYWERQQDLSDRTFDFVSLSARQMRWAVKKFPEL